MSATLAISFVHTAVLGATALAVAPVIIHLLMRSKPRLVVFPAMRFVKVCHTANVARHRLKHLLLLLMRMAAIALLAVVLARPKVETAAGLSLGAREPVSTVVIIDTSGSMAYRVAGQPRLEEAKRLACQLLEGLPGNSHTAALWPDRPGDAVPLSPDTGFTIRQVQALTDRPAKTAGPSGEEPPVRIGQRASMPALLARAYRSLANAPTRRREIHVFNDRTRDSWAELAPGKFASEPDATVYLLDVGARENQDFMVAGADWDAPLASPRRSPILTAKLQAGELAGKRLVEVEIDGRTVGRQEVDLPDKLSAAAAPFKLAPLNPGLHAGLVRLDSQDEIVENNIRYVVVEVGPLPQVLMVESPAAGGRAGWSVGDLVEAVLAPPQRVAAGTALADLIRVAAGDFLTGREGDPGKGGLDKAHAVILADVGVLGNEQWDALRNYVGSGGTLITLLGPGTDPAALTAPAAGGVLPVPGIERKVQLSPPGRAAMPDFDKPSSRVLATCRQHDKSPIIDRESVYQYYALPAGAALPPNTMVLIRLAGASSAPLLLERRLAAGASLLLTTSPQADWSDYSQGATWPVMLFAMTMTYNRGAQRAWQFTLDQPSAFTCPARFRGGSAAISLPGNRGQRSSVIGVSDGVVSLPTRYVGHYRAELRAPGGEKQELLYAVNFDPTEYGLQKMDPKELAAGFAPGQLVVLSDPTEIQRAQARGRASREEIGLLLGLALLLLMIGESFFSNRFYRAPLTTVAPSAGQTPVVRPNGA